MGQCNWAASMTYLKAMVIAGKRGAARHRKPLKTHVVMQELC